MTLFAVAKDDSDIKGSMIEDSFMVWVVFGNWYMVVVGLIEMCFFEESEFFLGLSQEMEWEDGGEGRQNYSDCDNDWMVVIVIVI